MGSTRWDRISLEPPIVCSLPVLNLPLGGQNQRFKTSKLRSHQKMGAFGCIWMHLLGNPPDFEGKNGHFKIHLTPGRHWILRDTRNHCKMLVVMSLKRQSKVFAGNMGRQKRQDYATWLMIAGLRSVLHRWTVSSPKLYRLIVFRDRYTLPWTWLAAGASIRQRAVQFWKFSLSPRPPGGLENMCPWHSCAVASDQPTNPHSAAKSTT